MYAWNLRAIVKSIEINGFDTFCIINAFKIDMTEIRSIQVPEMNAVITLCVQLENRMYDSTDAYKYDKLLYLKNLESTLKKLLPIKLFGGAKNKS